MRKNIIITAFLLSVVIMFGFNTLAESCTDEHKKTIFDGHIGTDTYKLISNRYDITNGIKSSARYAYLPAELKKSFKSKEIIVAQESWIGDPGILTIYRYYFEFKNDVIIYPETNFGPISTGFEKWDRNSEIGDKSCWITPGILLFAKDKTLVRVYLNSNLLEAEQQKAYIQKISKSIVKKLDSDSNDGHHPGEDEHDHHH